MVLLKFFKAFWLLSVVATLAVLLLVYANLPQQVVVYEKDAKLIMLSQEAVFYISLGVMAMVNVLVFAVTKLFKDDHFRIWFYGFVMTLNLFFIIALNFIGTFNSGEKFNYNSINFIIYGSVVLIILWALAWPLFSIYKKIFHKPAV
jgi:hypothetical protein